MKETKAEYAKVQIASTYYVLPPRLLFADSLRNQVESYGTAGREPWRIWARLVPILQSRTSQGANADAPRVRSLAAYKDFLTLWKDADPEIPILKQAKAEYAKLQ
jgi:hypothetical protein